MIIPKYWAEAKITTQYEKRQITIKRFGWSDMSMQDAYMHAETRVTEALEQLKSGQNIRKLDHKIPYNGSEGLPIREEIIQQHDDVVITRNSYGALCLNTPDVLFADIDFNYAPNSRLYLLGFVLLFFIGIVGAVLLKSWWVLAIGLFFSIVLSRQTAEILLGIQHKWLGSPEQQALKSIRQFSMQHPSWHLRVYQTPKGYRVLVMHQVFEPRSEETQQFFSALQADPNYVRMCKNQNCFRARISPKPWRIGVDALRLGVWPVQENRMLDRDRWIAEYQARAKKYASCKFIEQLGSQMTHPKAKRVQSTHDQYCNATTNLEIA
ncbi:MULTISPECIES: hypothetical protein [unclassified Acinetobacter]|uniref:hypothetical protein n=1 Tax=Acinetobacter TaxID=469 RepID=UPI0018AB97EB|nr:MULTISPECIES: hypothetical protein [unclassified Acinetobacter]MBJ9954680.1 hypothetical protein [Acinetobacter baumannii]